MDTKRFADSPIGSLVPIAGIDGRTGESFEHVAFAADPLASVPLLSPATWNAIAKASHALGRLEQGAQLVPNPALLRRPTLRREAQSTSALEGTYAPIEEVLAADVIDNATRSSALSEVMNYVRAAERAFDWVSDSRPVTAGLIAELHGVLVEGTQADTEDAGRVRQIQVVIGSRDGGVADARFIPMPPGIALEAGFGDLVQWMRPDQQHPQNPIARAAMAHYQFETLHPFNDGNGRLGRLLIVLQLMSEGLLSYGLLSVSPWFEQRRDEYQDLLAAVSATGAWDPWVHFFATGIEASAIDTADQMSNLLMVQADYQERLRADGARGVIRDVADFLIGNPYVTIPMLADATSKTYPALKTAVEKLIDLGILVELKSNAVRVFRATDVVRVTSRR